MAFVSAGKPPHSYSIPQVERIKIGHLLNNTALTRAIAQWFRRLLDAYKSGDVKQAIFVGFQLSILRICQEAMQYPFVIPEKRIAFWTTPENLEQRENKKKKPRMTAVQKHLERCSTDESQYVKSENGILVPSQHPSQDNVIIFLPDQANVAASIHRFRLEFKKFGIVKR